MIDLPTTTVSFKRHAPGAHVEGRYVEGGVTVLTAEASAQPLNGSEIKMLPEGRRNDEAMKFYTETKFQTSDEKNKINADLITYDGKEYEVHKVANWSIGTDIPHYKVIAVKLDGEGEG